MVKQIINIGVEGNDASGDPIREAFNKVNENFNELYAVFGKGGQISITSLSDGPSQVLPESILIANANASQYISKTLEGDGISIDNTDPEILKFTVTASKLISDKNPILSNHLDASNFDIFRVGNPNSTVAAHYAVPLDSFAINKGYADSNYVNNTGDTMTGPLIVPAGQTGTGVARANETVLKTGGTSNQLQGPLILFEDPLETDNPLTATTKNYVDSSTYYSKINLYVNTKGTDNQFIYPTDKQGRSPSYAFASIGAACRYGETLINSAPVTIGPYRKRITYNNGANFSTVASITQTSGSYYLYITNAGPQTDPRNGNNITPGQLIHGILSDAYAFIVSLGAVSGNQELYIVQYTGTNTFQVGEGLEWGNSIKNLQLTVLIEAGDYYEHYPIRVPENTTILGDEMRRVVVHPKSGRSAGFHVDTYFRRDTTFDSTLTIATQNYGRHYLTDSTKPLYTGTISNPGYYNNSASLIIANKNFLIAETIGYVNQVWNGLDYNQTTCARDLGYIIDALAYDMAFGSNYQSIMAGKAYFRGLEAAVVLGAEKTATLDSLTYLSGLLSNQVIGANSKLSITNNITVIKNIITNGISSTPTISWTSPSWIDTGFSNARQILIDNISFIQAETIAYLTANYSSLNYNLTTCERDILYIINAIVYDLTYGGNSMSIQAGYAYYSGNSLIINSSEITPIYQTYGYMENVIGSIINGTAFTPLQTNVQRYADVPGSPAAATAAETLVEDIRNIIQSNSSPTVINPSVNLQSSDIVTNFSAIESVKTSTISSVISYINSNYFLYNSTLCKRDLGLIIDALTYDLINGGYYKILEAGNAYFKDVSGLRVIDNTTTVVTIGGNPVTELQITVAAMSYLSGLAVRIIQNFAPLTDYQNAYGSSVSQVIDNSIIYETGSDTAISGLFTFINHILSQDSSFNPPKNNEDIDVFLMNNATTMRNISGQGHGGFMVVLDPLGQIATKSPYIENCASFARSINAKHFAGGMFIDGFVGNLTATIVSRISSTQITVSGLTVRAPQTPCSFYITGVRFEVDTVTNYDPIAGTATINLDPLTPDTSSYTGSSNSFLISTLGIEFISPGNNSMCTSNFTQVNDLGYGVAAVNLGLVEAVSVFTYYAQVGYYVDTGAQIRSANGSCGYGAFALQANGASPLEVPNAVTIRYDMSIGASVYSPDDYYSAITGSNVSGSGINASFNVRVTSTSYIVYLSSGGTSYANGNQITLLGTLFQGIAVTNDITITVTSVSSGSITGFTYSGTVPTGAPFNTYHNNATSLIFYVDSLTTDYIPVNGSEVEIIQGTAPQRISNRYTMNNAQVVTDTGVPRPYNKTLYRIVLQSLGLTSTGYQGLLAAIPDGTKVVFRQNNSVWLQGINKDTATRPSTALFLSQDPTYIYRVIAISNIAVHTGTYVWLNNTVTVTTPGHGLIDGETISITFSNGNPTDPLRGLYNITYISTSQFSISSQVPTNLEVDGNVSFSTNINEGQTALKEGFRAINANLYYDAYAQPYQPRTVIVVSLNSSTNLITCYSTAALSLNQAVVFTGTVGGITAGTTYYVKSIPSTTTFSISTSSGGSTLSLTSFSTSTLTATATTATTNLITVSSTSLLYSGQIIRFSGIMQGGLITDTLYYVLPGFTSTQFQVSLTKGGSAVTLTTSVCSMTITPDPLYGTTDISGSNYYTWGVTGSLRVAIRDLSDYDRTRLNAAISIGEYYIFAWNGKPHSITNYVPSTSSSIGIGYLEFDNLTGTGLAAPIGLLEGGFKNSPTIRANLQGSSAGNITINISTLRATNHDMLSIGTGGYSTSNFPNIIYGQPDITKNQAAEVVELGKGRVFYVTSDQDGNFRVGSFFSVDQGTGTVTFASSIAISNLDGLGFKRGVAVSEFSVDDTMFDNATDEVPVQQAIRGYIDRRLGLTHNGSIVVASNLIPGINSGYMSLDGRLAMKANMNLNGYAINNLLDPVNASDAATKEYVDLFLRRSAGTRSSIDNFQMSTNTYTSTTANVTNLNGTGPYTATITGLTSSTTLLPSNILELIVIATPGTGSLGSGYVTVTSITSGNSINVSSSLPMTSGTITNLYVLSGTIDMNNNNIINVATPVNANDAVNKSYVDVGKTIQGQTGVNLPTPLAGNVTNNSLFVFNGTAFTWGSMTGDVNVSLSGNTLTASIQPSKIVNSMVSSSAAISQSKLNLSSSTTGTSGTAVSGICSFDQTYFTSNSGFISLAANSITLSSLGAISSNTVIGNNSALPANPTALSFSTIVQSGGGLYQSQFTSNGALVRTGSNTFSTVAYGTTTDFGTLVQRDSSNGGFSATIINASTQLNIAGNKVFDNTGSAPNQILEMFTPQGNLSIATSTSGGTVTGTLYGNWTLNGTSLTLGTTGTSGLFNGNWSGTGNWTLGGTSSTGTLAGTWGITGSCTISGTTTLSAASIALGNSAGGTTGTIYGAWALGTGATLESTYAADIAEYYQGDKTYDVGTVVMIGGDFDVTLASGSGTTKVAGVISNNAAYIMNGSCPGLKNLVALQGRVPCKVIGKVEKGDLMVVGIVPGVAMASSDPKPGSIIGKALQNYDSDHVGMIEIMVGKH